MYLLHIWGGGGVENVLILVRDFKKFVPWQVSEVDLCRKLDVKESRSFF